MTRMDARAIQGSATARTPSTMFGKGEIRCPASTSRSRRPLAAVLVAVAPAGASQTALPKLVATDGPGFTITLKKAGKKVMKIKAGRYSITVKDLSARTTSTSPGPA